MFPIVFPPPECFRSYSSGTNPGGRSTRSDDDNKPGLNRWVLFHSDSNTALFRYFFSLLILLFIHSFKNAFLQWQRCGTSCIKKTLFEHKKKLKHFFRCNHCSYTQCLRLWGLIRAEEMLGKKTALNKTFLDNTGFFK